MGMLRQIGVNNSKYGIFDDRIFTPAPFGLKFPNFALQISFFCLQDTVPVIVDAFVPHIFYSTWVQRLAYQKQLLGPK